MRSIWRPQRAKLTVNQRVLGSSPSSGALKIKRLREIATSFSLYFHPCFGAGFRLSRKGRLFVIPSGKSAIFPDDRDKKQFPSGKPAVFPDGIGTNQRCAGGIGFGMPSASGFWLCTGLMPGR